MSNPLNEIRLTADMIAMLYGSSLVEIPANRPGAAKQIKRKATTPHFLGENRKNITLLVNNPDYTFLPESELSLLSKVLEACNVNLGDVAIVNTNGNQTEEPDTTALEPVIILDFRGRSEYELFSIRNNGGIQILNAPSINRFTEESAESRQLKIRLWTSLKLLFRI